MILIFTIRSKMIYFTIFNYLRIYKIYNTIILKILFNHNKYFVLSKKWNGLYTYKKNWFLLADTKCTCADFILRFEFLKILFKYAPEYCSTKILWKCQSTNDHSFDFTYVYWPVRISYFIYKDEIMYWNNKYTFPRKMCYTRDPTIAISSNCLTVVK